MILISLCFTLISGYLLSVVFSRDLPTAERLSLAFPIGIALTTWSIWIALCLKINVQPFPFLVFQALLILGLFKLSPKSDPSIGWTQPKLVFNGSILLIVLLVLPSIAFNLFYPVITPDGIYYKALGHVTLQESDIMAFRDRTFVTDQNRTLGFHLISSYWSLFGSSLHKLTQTFLYINFISIFYFLIRRFLNQKHAFIILLLLASSPMIWWHSFLYLNNLQAGLYFFTANTYWFIAYREKRKDILFLASFLFMCAQWTRYELTVLFLVPLAISIYFSIKENDSKWVWNLLSFPLFFTGVWAVYSLIYYPDQKHTFKFILLFGVFVLFTFVPKIAIRFKTLLFRSWPALLYFIPIAYFLGIFIVFGPERALLISEITWAKALNNTLCQSVWGLGILLTLAIPFYYSEFDHLEKALFFNFLGIFVGFTLLFSVFVKGHPMMDQSSWQRILFFIQNPGQIAVRTSSREFFILFPTLLLFLGTIILGERKREGKLLSITNVLSSTSIGNPLRFFVLGNLAVILFFFLSPRVDFMSKYLDRPSEDILTSIGPKDIHNLYIDTYLIAHAVAKETPENSVIYFPNPFGALSFKKKPYDSIGVFMAMDALYPRQLFWHGTERKAAQDIKSWPKFQVAFDDWEYDKCKDNSPKMPIGHHNWQICKLD
jgi:hypothetical protein